MINWYVVIVPVILTILGGGLLALVPVVFRLSNRLALADERISRLTVALDEERRRNDAQDQRQGAAEIVLAKIDSKLDLLLSKFQQAHLP